MRYKKIRITRRLFGQRPRQGPWGKIPYVRPSVRTSPLWLALRPVSQGLRASQQGLSARKRGLGASQQSLRASQRGADGRADGRTDVQNFSPFYWTLSPVGAAALLRFVISPHQECLKCFCLLNRDEPATNLLLLPVTCYLYINGACTDIGEGSKRRESLEQVMQEAEMLVVLRGENRRKLEKGERYSETMSSS